LQEQALKYTGSIDVWINNAGIFDVLPEGTRLPPDVEKAVYQLNYQAAIDGTQFAFACMGNQRLGGTIINMGTLMADYRLQNVAKEPSYYIKSKRDLMKETQKIAEQIEKLNKQREIEGKSPIKIYVAMPESVDTPFYHHAINYTKAELIPPSPVLSPEAVARKLVELVERNPQDILQPIGILAKLTHATAKNPLVSKFFAHYIDSSEKNLTQHMPHSLGILYKSTEIFDEEVKKKGLEHVDTSVPLLEIKEDIKAPAPQ